MRHFILTVLLLYISFFLFAQKDSTNQANDSTIKNDTAYTINLDDPIIAMMDLTLDSLLSIQDGNPYKDYKYHKGPEISEKEIKEALAILNEQTPIDLRYNYATKAYIDLYASKYRKYSSKILGLKNSFFPIFEDALSRHKLPLELKYLAIVESALNPAAESHAGAGGLWQFMPSTGKAYGLDITTYTDERKDIFKSTEAACVYLKFLYRIYHDWNLALAAYNAGPGNVNKALRRSGKKTYWGIFYELPQETQGYVPAFIAMNYIMNYYEKHELFPIKPPYKYINIDTLCVNRRVDFDVLSKHIDEPVENLKKINPMYTFGIIPKSKEGNTLYLFRDKVGDFIANEDSIYSKSLIPKSDEKLLEKELALKEKTKNGKSFTYKVKSGDYLGKIAEKFDVKVSDIKKWNNLKSNSLKIGQKLYIKGGKEKAAVAKQKEKLSGYYKYYVIKDGDTLWNIAKSNNTSIEKIQQSNPGLTASNLKIGKKIKIPLNK